MAVPGAGPGGPPGAGHVSAPSSACSFVHSVLQRDVPQALAWWWCSLPGWGFQPPGEGRAKARGTVASGPPVDTQPRRAQWGQGQTRPASQHPPCSLEAWGCRPTPPQASLAASPLSLLWPRGAPSTCCSICQPCFSLPVPPLPSTPQISSDSPPPSQETLLTPLRVALTLNTHTVFRARGRGFYWQEGHPHFTRVLITMKLIKVNMKMHFQKAGFPNPLSSPNPTVRL